MTLSSALHAPLMPGIGTSEGSYEDISHELLRRCRVLVVDDEPLLREAVSAFLEADGYTKIDNAGNGREALEKVESFNPDIVILDVMMPEMDGLEVCRRLRATSRFRRLPILVQTGLDDRQSRIDVFRAGATDLINKPVVAEELIARVRVHLENRMLIGQLEEYRVRMEADLETAHGMQGDLLPKPEVIQAIRDRHGLALNSRFVPSSALGGDCWGTIDLDANTLGLYLVDFSGHGVAPAVNTFRLHALLGEMRARVADPSRLLPAVNGRLYKLLPREQFAVMLYGIFDFQHHTFTYAAAGTPGPFLIDNASGAVERLDSAGLPLGFREQHSYPARQIKFPPGAGLLLYSDGFSDTRDNDGSRRGEEGLEVLVRETAQGDPEKTLERLFKAAFRDNSEPPEDDLTVVHCYRLP